MRKLSVRIAKSLLSASRLVKADHKDYGKLPPTHPDRMSSPSQQKRNIHQLLKTPPFSKEWINKNILSAFFMMENSPEFAKTFPQVQSLSQSFSAHKLDRFRSEVESLTDDLVGNDYSVIEPFVSKSRKLLASLDETLHKMPRDFQSIQLWVEKLQQLSEAFSTVLDEGILEVKTYKNK